MNLSAKSYIQVIIEASVVGICLILLVKLVKDYLLQYIPDLSGNKNTIELFFIAGFLFHILFEYSGLNMWYSKEYCKLII